MAAMGASLRAETAETIRTVATERAETGAPVVLAVPKAGAVQLPAVKRRRPV